MKVLLLTLFPPGARYGSRIICRYLAKLPSRTCVWASLQSGPAGVVESVPHMAFGPMLPHWRLGRMALGWWLTHEAQAYFIAHRIRSWVRVHRPNILWVVPELGAAPVAWWLKKMLSLPTHVTSHDAHETARGIVPSFYYPFYARSVRRILAAADSLDAVSDELLQYHCLRYSNLRPENTMVLPPSIEVDAIRSPAATPLEGRTGPIRIGLCGSMRVNPPQWSAFLELLGSLPLRFEILAFVYEDLFPNRMVPSNVTITRRSYAATEDDLIREFAAGVHACYLGLFKEEHRRLFSQTSLSAKLTTYLAAATPVIVDGPEDSAAWRLASEYGAGVLIGTDMAAAKTELIRLFTDHTFRQRKAEGARRLCIERCNADANVAKLAELLQRTARKAGA